MNTVILNQSIYNKPRRADVEKDRQGKATISIHWCSIWAHTRILSTTQQGRVEEGDSCPSFKTKAVTDHSVLLVSRWAGRLRPLGPLPRAGVRVSLQPQTERSHGGRHLPQVVGPQVGLKDLQSLTASAHHSDLPTSVYSLGCRSKNNLLNFTLHFSLLLLCPRLSPRTGWQRLRD